MLHFIVRLVNGVIIPSKLTLCDLIGGFILDIGIIADLSLILRLKLMLLIF